MNVSHLSVQIDDELGTAPDNKAFNQAFENVIAGGNHICFINIESGSINGVHFFTLLGIFLHFTPKSGRPTKFKFRQF